jgi:hypothetical protein
MPVTVLLYLLPFRKDRKDRKQRYLTDFRNTVNRSKIK